MCFSLAVDIRVVQVDLDAICEQFVTNTRCPLPRLRVVIPLIAEDCRRYVVGQEETYFCIRQEVIVLNTRR
jgi:hypothetical protein